MAGQRAVSTDSNAPSVDCENSFRDSLVLDTTIISNPEPSPSNESGREILKVMQERMQQMEQFMLQMRDEQRSATSMILERQKEILGTQHDSALDVKEILETQRETLELQKDDSSTLQELFSNVKEISGTQHDSALDVKEILETQREITSEQRRLADNQVDSAIISNDLTAKTNEAKDLQSKLNSERGKRGAVTRKLNQEKAKVAEMEEERTTTIKNAELMNEIRSQGEQTRSRIDIVEESRRIRKHQERVNAHGDHLSYLRGDPTDSSPYDTWMEANWYTDHYDEFKHNLEQNYKNAKPLARRYDLPPCADFSEASKISLFEYGLGVVLSSGNIVDLDNSPAKHMYNLALLSMPIFREDIFEEKKNNYEIQVEFFCRKLSKPYTKDTTIYHYIEGDAFLHPSVSVNRFFYVELIF